MLPGCQMFSDPGQLGRIEKDLPEEHLLRPVIQPTNDVALQGITAHGAHILGLAALPATIQGGDGEALGHVAQLRKPIARTAGIAVEHKHGRVGGGG